MGGERGGGVDFTSYTHSSLVDVTHAKTLVNLSSQLKL